MRMPFMSLVLLKRCKVQQFQRHRGHNTTHQMDAKAPRELDGLSTALSILLYGFPTPSLSTPS